MPKSGSTHCSPRAPATWRMRATAPTCASSRPSPTPVVALGAIGAGVRRSLTAPRLRALMRELARVAPRRGAHRVFFVGGGTAVLLGFRPSTIDADLCADRDEVFHDVQGIKERLEVNIEFARPEHFVPP